jgi:DNA polymerase
MCPEIDRTFRQGRDSYRMFASKYYDIPYEEVTKAQRSFSKPPVLGCGFMLGWKGLIAYAEGYGVDMSQDQAKMAVDTFRGMYPEIPAFWKWIDQAAKYVTQTGMPLEGYRLKIERDDVMLRIWLPSGRALSYYLPEVQRREAPWSTPESVWMIDNFTYMGMNDKSQWVRISAHAGGLTENIVQSLAGDILWSGIRNATDRGLPVVLHVHDEIAGEVPDEYAEQWLEVLQECMTRQPHWCRDMWLGADGFITKRYTKD